MHHQISRTEARQALSGVNINTLGMSEGMPTVSDGGGWGSSRVGACPASDVTWRTVANGMLAHPTLVFSGRGSDCSGSHELRSAEGHNPGSGRSEGEDSEIRLSGFNTPGIVEGSPRTLAC